MPARATVIDVATVCPPALTSCTIDRDYDVAPDATLDFGSRPLTLKRGATLDAGPAAFTLKSGALTLEPGAALLARGRQGPSGGTITLELTGDLRLQASGNTRARIDVSAQDTGGKLDLTVGGDVDLDGVLAAQATAGGRGGDIALSATGRMTIGPDAEIHAQGGGQGDGGTVTLGGSDILISGPTDVSGADGGGFDLTATGDVTTTLHGTIDASAAASVGEGGTVTLDTDGSMTIGGRIDATASGNSLEGGIIGGAVGMTAGGSLTIAAIINAAGAPPDGLGGDVDLLADLDIVQTAPVIVRNATLEGAGGTVTYKAGRQLVIGALIDMEGGGGAGGSLLATAGTSAIVGGEIDADAPGDGGDIIVRASDLTVQSSIHANGTGDGFGGDTELTGACALTIAATARVSAVGGAAGQNFLRQGRQLEIAAGAQLTAGAANNIFHRSTAATPVIAGAVSPAAQSVLDQTVPACPGSATCGDGTVDAGEECDDGNTAACDGCSPTCQRESCGNGTIDCHETCDDGNQVDGDGCDHTCTRTACGNHVVTDGEDCDDGNLAACDGCSPACRTERCGNGVLECDEECDAGDAGNQDPQSGCDQTCHRRPPPGCGNGMHDPGEECDDGNTTPCDGCSADCQTEGCGNGQPECTEQCDDFNTEACDGCNPNCRVERCGNGVTDCGEECDDGNAVDGDGCDTNCTRTRCGNGITTPPEQCDDGNTIDADRCDTACRRRVPCDGGTCVSCTGDLDCDPNGRCAGQQCVANVCTSVTPFSCDDGLATTSDRCVLDSGGAPSCTHACLQASACDDHDPCNGTETCTAGSCGPGSPPGGFIGAGCGLDLFDAALAGPDGAALRPSILRKLKTLGATARGRLAAAVKAANGGKRKQQLATLSGADKSLASLGRFITRGGKHGKISESLASRLGPAVDGAAQDVDELRAALRH